MPERQMKTLFEKPLSHTNDPQTSFDAADRMVRSGALNRQEWEVLNVIEWYAREHFRRSQTKLTFTAKELAKWGSLDYFLIQRRLSGLHNKDKIERTGGKRDGCCVWRIK